MKTQRKCDRAIFTVVFQVGMAASRKVLAELLAETVFCAATASSIAASKKIAESGRKFCQGAGNFFDFVMCPSVS